MLEILAKCPLFRGIQEAELAVLLERINHQVRQFRGGELLAQAGDEVDKAMILLQGRVQGEMVDFTGNILKIEEMDPPQMIAAAFIFGPQSRFPVFLSAKMDGKMLIFNKKGFVSLLAADQRVMVNFLGIISAKAQFLTGKITFLSLRTIREKIAFYLLQHLKSGTGTEVRIRQTQTSLADLFGVARPSLTRAILGMEQEGIMTWTKEKVIIHDIKRLNLVLGR